MGNTISRNSILVALGVIVTVIIGGVIFSPENTIQIIGFGSVICVSLLAQLQRISTDAKVVNVQNSLEAASQATYEKLDKVAEKAEVVKAALGVSEESTANKLDDMANSVAENQKTIGVVHALVNSSMSNQLRINMLALKRVADLTGHQDDIAAADLAAKNFFEHEEKEAKIHAKLADNDKHEPTPVVIVPASMPLPVQIRPGTKPKANGP